jgi:hypothetical protein
MPTSCKPRSSQPNSRRHETNSIHYTAKWLDLFDKQTRIACMTHTVLALGHLAHELDDRLAALAQDLVLDVDALEVRRVPADVPGRKPRQKSGLAHPVPPDKRVPAHATIATRTHALIWMLAEDSGKPWWHHVENARIICTWSESCSDRQLYIKRILFSSYKMFLGKHDRIPVPVL